MKIFVGGWINVGFDRFLCGSTSEMQSRFPTFIVTHRTPSKLILTRPLLAPSSCCPRHTLRLDALTPHRLDAPLPIVSLPATPFFPLILSIFSLLHTLRLIFN